MNYTYDGDGNRVQKSNGKIYWYGAGTEILEETDATGSMTNASFFEYVYFDGKRIARRDSSGNVFYYLEDALGTSRGIVEIAAGQTSVCYDADYYPYGGEKVYTNTCPQNYKFEGKERDTETGNDDFGARYYSSVYGRWLSPDWSAIPAPVPYANLNNPQTLNLYAMVADNPETFADLDGHDSTGSSGAACDANTSVGCDGKINSNQYIGNAGGWYNHLVNSNSSSQQQNQTSSNNSNGQQNSGNAGDQSTGQSPQSQQKPPSGINPNYTFDHILKRTSNFSAGAGDVLSLGTTYLARKYIFNVDSVVDKGSWWYWGGATTGTAIWFGLSGPGGPIFGTRYAGNQPLLNSGTSIRIGWSYIRPAGQYVFRIGGALVGKIKSNPHINLWPPSWWDK